MDRSVRMTVVAVALLVVGGVLICRLSKAPVETEPAEPPPRTAPQEAVEPEGFIARTR